MAHLGRNYDHRSPGVIVTVLTLLMVARPFCGVQGQHLVAFRDTLIRGWSSLFGSLVAGFGHVIIGLVVEGVAVVVVVVVVVVLVDGGERVKKRDKGQRARFRQLS